MKKRMDQRRREVAERKLMANEDKSKPTRRKRTRSDVVEIVVL